MKSQDEILSLMRRYKPTAQKKYGMTRIGIFGSVARGEQTDDSDVDVCYEGEAPSLLTLDKIQVELEQLLGCRVDLVRVRDNMNSLLRKRILSEGIYV
jgi:predicted nucleotidyltransferase